MQWLMLNTVFLGGLREDIRSRVLEEGPTEPDESAQLAREIESIINDRRREKGYNVTNIGRPRRVAAIEEADGPANQKSLNY